MHGWGHEAGVGINYSVNVSQSGSNDYTGHELELENGD